MKLITKEDIYGYFSIVVEQSLTCIKVSVLHPDNEKSLLRTFSNVDEACEYARDLAFEYRLLAPRRL